jgi:TatD DNase family protein
MIDSHCHLDAAEFDLDRAAVTHAAVSAGVRMIIVPAVARDNFARVAALGQQPNVCYALGIHPTYVDRAADADLPALRAAVLTALPDPRFVAIGEIGLDFFVAGLDRERQTLFYEQQLRIAKEFDLPVILHVRRAQDQVLKFLRKYHIRRGIAHAFNGSQQQALAFLAQGLVLGFGGAMTFSRALQIRRLVADLPAHAHVLETDAPDIAPQWLHPRRNAPTELPAIAQVFAQLRQSELPACIADTTANVRRVLPRLTALLDA